MKTSWHPADILDWHAVVQSDEQLRHDQGEVVLAERDRALYCEQIKPRLQSATPPEAQELGLHWLAARRKMAATAPEPQVLPGSIWQGFFTFCRRIAILGGLLCGALTAGGFLIYSGKTPLNVSVYFALFVLVQILLIGLQGATLGLRLLCRRPLRPGWFTSLLAGLLQTSLTRLARQVQTRVDGATRLSYATLTATLRKNSNFAPVLLWVAFILLQWIGLCFNLGVLMATLAKVAFTDIAFAWQSTLQFSVESVAKLVQWIALPWAWLPQAYPSLTQIQGSQLVLKDGIAPLASANLASWWPFLCLSVFCYGIVPRLLLLLLGLWSERRTLERLVQQLPLLEALRRRMLQPRLSTQALETATTRPATATSSPQPADEAIQNAQPGSKAAEPSTSKQASACLVLIPEELFADCPLPALQAQLQKTWPYKQTICRAFEPNLALVAAAELLAPTAEATTDGDIFLLQEAWQPPIRESLTLLQALCRAAGPQRRLTLLLIGKPKATTMLSAPNPAQVQVWQQTIQTLAEPTLSAVPLYAS